MARTAPCDAGTRAGRLSKAEQFHEAADVIAQLAQDEGDVSDAYVTLLVHAGIASADVVCCARLGRHSQGENHNDAISLIAKVDQRLAADLRTLLSLKTKAGYSHAAISATDRRKAARAAAHLLDAAREA